MSRNGEGILAVLATAYIREMETVLNHQAYSTNLDGVRAEEINKSLAAEIAEEIAMLNS